jgi:hypothetical protein
MKLRRITWKTDSLSARMACAQWLRDEGYTATATVTEQEPDQWVSIWTMTRSTRG